MVPVAAALLLGSCSLMHDDLPDCAVAPEVCAAVNFTYDYNTEGTDLFHDHIGSVTLYVCDTDGRLIRTVEHTASAHDIHSEGWSMPLELPAGTYLLYASARENADGYEAAMAGAGAKFRRSACAPGTAASAITYSLDHVEGTVDHDGLPLEHLWLTREPQTLVLPVPETPAEGDPQPEDIVVTATVPLQRVCNNIHVDVVRADSRASRAETISPDDYDLWIGTADGRHQLDLTARPTDGALPLTYTPHSVLPGTTQSGADCIAADFSTSRLVYNSSASTRDMLCIRDKSTGDVTAIDLTSYLAQGRDAYGRGWSEQEYLDRAYDFNCTVAIDSQTSEWVYVDVHIYMLNWSKRIQNVTL